MAISKVGASEIKTAERHIAAGNRAEDEGRLPEACERYRAAVNAAPQYAPAHLNLGIGLEAAGDTEGALKCYERALALDPASPYVNYNLGKLLYSRQDLNRAEHLLRGALESKPAFPEANVLLSSLYDTQKKFLSAAAELETALKHRPQYVGALRNYAIVLNKLSRWPEAESALRRALVAEPTNVDILQSLGGLIARQGRPDEAIECYETAIALQPDPAEAHWNLGNVLADQGRLDDATVHYREALTLQPDFVDAQHSLCLALYAQGRPTDAIACLRNILTHYTDFTDGYLSLGNILRSELRLDEAVESLQQALALKPKLVDAHLSLAKIHTVRGDVDGTIRCYRKVLSIDPESVPARWSMAVLQGAYETDAAADSQIALFRQLDELDRWIGEARLASSVAVVGEQTLFYLAYQEHNHRELLQRYGALCSRIMAGWFKRQRLTSSTNARRGDVIRVGVVSAHFQNHSVWNALVKGWFQHIDRTHFALDAFYLGTDCDEETRLAQSLASHFEQANGSLRGCVQAIMNRQPDVLVYPEIGMDSMTVKLASLRLAPVQLATWGHPETTGLPTIDYFVSANDFEPEDASAHYTEKLALLPHFGCCYSARRTTPIAQDLSGLGIDPSVPILICPGTPFKYASRHDRVFAEIAKQLDDCTFIFFTYRVPELSNKLRNRLQAAFANHGLDADKFLRFIPWQKPAQFHGLMGRAHVFLDTIGFSGFNTAMQAVECSLPIVTREGGFLRGRFASGILKRMGLQELVARTEDDYVGLVVKICRDSGYRAHIRERIEAQRSILFDDHAPIRVLEDLLARVAMPR